MSYEDAIKKVEARNKALGEKMLRDPSSRHKKETTPTGSSSTGAENSGGNGGTPPPPVNPSRPNAVAQPNRPTDGISHAYDFDVDDFDMKKKKEKKQKSKGEEFKLPERKKGGKGGGGKDIMEVIWNECIVAFYETVLDVVVDTPWDFIKSSIEAAFRDRSTVEEKSEERKNIYEYGILARDATLKDVDEFEKKLLKPYEEIVENLQREKDGNEPVWKEWNGEPKPLYAKIKELAAQAEANPNSEAAKKIEIFHNTAKSIKSMIKQEKNIIKLAYSIGIVKQVADEINPLRQVNSIKEAINKGDSKEKILKEIKEIKNLYESSDTPHSEIDISLQKMEQIIAKEKTVAELKSELNGEALNLGKAVEKTSINVTENVIKANITRNSEIYYAKIKGSLDKIAATYQNDEVKRKEAVHSYISDIKSSVKAAKEKTDKIIESGKEDKDSSTKKEAQKLISECIEKLDYKNGSSQETPEQSYSFNKDGMKPSDILRGHYMNCIGGR